MNVLAVTEAAPGYGNLQADIFFVGQSLCTACMGTQIPFTRGSGYLIDAALYVVGLERKDIFISNVVHCHPPHNRASEDYEIRYCRPYLIEEIELIKPALVIVMGNEAARALKAATILVDSKLLYIPHPAYLLRKGGRGSKDWVIKIAIEMEKVLP